ncbi:MAG: glucose-1-phosphate adenylyltransferase [Verrucomicrobiota bacterium]|nr:glucose-1-phosphate adenylyltransferase [Verrucomicrobiota bacterium]
MNRVLAVIMGGGQGTRLFPLTKDRSKPAVPLVGKYRLVDIPISNCINSGIRRIYLLTQFNSTSLHRHVQQSYQFDLFSSGFVEILAAQQTFSNSTGWYQGTADAVRQNMVHFRNHQCDYIVILSGDQLYRMDFKEMLAEHIARGSDITIATLPVKRHGASALGILQTDDEQKIVRFEEKPKDPALLDDLKMTDAVKARFELTGSDDYYLASMGIYIFSTQVLETVLANDKADFGKHIIPDSINKFKMGAFIFNGYWEDIGTIKSFFEANLDATVPVPAFNYFDLERPIYTHPRYLPATKMNGANVKDTIVADGCIITEAFLERSIVGIRSMIGRGSSLKEVIMMGADMYDSDSDRQRQRDQGKPPMGVGNHCEIRRSIIDKNARIGDYVRISPDGKPEEMDGPNFYIREGIVCIPKNAIIPNGTVI